MIRFSYSILNTILMTYIQRGLSEASDVSQINKKLVSMFFRLPARFLCLHSKYGCMFESLMGQASFARRMSEEA